MRRSTRSDETPNARAQPVHTLRSLYEHLLHHYGPQRWWPSRSVFETIVGAYLVQNTSWKGVVRSIANLEASEALSMDGLRALPLEDLRLLIRPTGYMVRKAAALKSFIGFVDTHFSGSIKRLAAQPTDVLRAQLLDLPGVGPETADVILLYALGHPVMVVDEYLRRVAHRHGFTLGRLRYEELQKMALSAFSNDAPATLLKHFNEFHALIVEVGKNHCGPRPKCNGCPLEPYLPDAAGSPSGDFVQIEPAS